MPILSGDEIYNFKWYEKKVINAGSNNMTLTNTVINGDNLMIYDDKYFALWESGVHWTRNGQIISLTESALIETLNFYIYCFR